MSSPAAETPAAVAGLFVEVAVPVPLRRTFTYEVPEGMMGSIRPGAQVHVSFAGRKLSGFVVSTAGASAVEGVKPLLGVEPPEFGLPDELVRLCRWVSEYYLAPPGEVFRAALPAGLGKKSPGEVPEAAGTPAELVLEPEQAAALGAVSDAIRARETAAFLLYGVTGSGKTEVYLRAAEEAVRAGGNVLILVPEIALSPQMVGRVEARFGHRVALWHSALTPARRREVWARTRRGEIDVLVGARSAVFAPLPDLRLVVVDEEHENAYKQAESPRYHARDVALVRARGAGAVAVLGSATPSLESMANARRGKYRLLRLPRRVVGRERSPVVLAPLPHLADEKGKRPLSPILGDLLRQAMLGTFQRGEQCILFLNRRGHSTVVQCDTCRTPLRCSQCDIALTWHSDGDAVVCHYCGRSRPTPTACPAGGSCRGTLSVFKGVGTQRVARELARLFAGVRVLRLDTDSVKKRGSLERALESFRRGEADVLLGTQMVAKGLDFPNVTLVGVINADIQLALPDFRSAERTFQLLTQVAGRSGRGDREGQVIFQTNRGDHFALTTAAAQDYDAFYREEFEARRDPAYPPHVRLVNLLVDGKDETLVIARAEAIADALRDRMGDAKDVDILGPAPQPLSKLKGKHRWHVTLRGTDHRRLRDLAAAALDEGVPVPRGIRVGVDVDPASLL